MRDLLNYLSSLDVPGGKAEYETRLLRTWTGDPGDTPDASRWPYLAGHYEGLLQLVIGCVGLDLLERLVEARADVYDLEDQLRKAHNELAEEMSARSEVETTWDDD